jgi:hypothetical protein
MAILRFTVNYVIPVCLVVGLNLATRMGYFSLLPLNPVIEKEYGNFALLLGGSAGLVASMAFADERRPFSVGAFIATALVTLIAASPFLLDRTGITLGLPPRHFDLLGTLAYLAFFTMVGLLIGGCWSVVVKAARYSRQH